MEIGTQRTSDLSPGVPPKRRVRHGKEPGKEPRARREEPELALRLRPDGVVETIEVTREILLNPSLEVKVVQSPPHYKTLQPAVERLRHFLDPRGLQVFSDVLVDWPNARDVSPDISMIENLRARRRQPGETAPQSVDVAAEGCRVRAVLEVVSPGRPARQKDEDDNPPLFAQQGVDDCVLLYTPEYRKPGEPAIRVFSDPSPSGYATELTPDAEGFFLLRSIGVRIGVETTSQGDEEIVLVDAVTGQRLTDRKEEAERADSEAERADAADTRTARMVITVLEQRGVPVDDAVRRRILECRGTELDLLTQRAWSVSSARELFEAPII